MKKTKLILSLQLAKWLLTNGFTIVDLKPNRNNPTASVYVFQLAPGFGKCIQQWIDTGGEQEDGYDD